MGDQRTLFFCFCLPWAGLIKIYGDGEKQGKMKKGDNQMLKRKKKLVCVCGGGKANERETESDLEGKRLTKRKRYNKMKIYV